LSRKDYKPKDLSRFTLEKDFDRNIRNDTLSYSPKSPKVKIEALKPHEKVGPKWYAAASGS